MRQQASEIVKSYKDLLVWQASRVLVKDIYLLTVNFPREEVYGLTSQMRRAAVSVPSNLAEGHSRRGLKDYTNYVSIAIGSISELETQILLAQDIGFISENQTIPIMQKVEDVKRMLSGLRTSLHKRQLSVVPQTDA